MKNQKINYLVISIVFFICLLVFGFGRNYLQKQNLPLSSPITPTANIVVDKTTDWKTYTNSGFGVSFKYPSNVFVYRGSPQTETQYWSNKPDGSTPMELGQDGVWMNLSVTKLDDAGYNFWSNKINVDKLGPKTATSSEVLQILNTDGIRGVVYHDLPKPSTEAAYTYTAMWLKDKTLYKLFLAATTDANLTLHKSTFDQILATFKFTQ